MLENNSSFKIHNKFELKLYDQDGNLKQEAFGYNEANSEKFVGANAAQPFASSNLATNYITHSYNNQFGRLIMGEGDPNTFTPTNKDYKLNKALFAQSISFYRISEFKQNYDTIEYRSNEVTFPATLDYVGDLTELGIDGYLSTSGYPVNQYQSLFSHAYIVDIANNPIIIKKTEYDILKVIATIYVTPILADIDVNLKFKYFPAYASSLGGGGNVGAYDSYNINTAALFDYIFPSARGGNIFYFSPQYVPKSNDNKIYNLPMSLSERPAIRSTITKNGNSIKDSNAGTEDFSNYFPITYKSSNQLSTQNDCNFGFAHSIIFPSLGAIELPNSYIVPEYSIKNIAIGTGDGTTTHFFNSINEIALDETNTPKIVVYIQNSDEENKQIVDPSNYEFVNFNIKKSPLWNKMLYVEDANGERFFSHSPIMFQDKEPSSNAEYVCFATYCALTNDIVFMKASNYLGGASLGRAIAPGSELSIIYYDEQGITLDQAKIGAFNTYRNGAEKKPLSLFISYKNTEEEEWTQIIIPPSDMTQFIVTFFNEPITAKYWKLQTSDYNNSSYGSAIRLTLQGSNRLGNLTMSQLKNQDVYGYDPNYIVVGNSAEYDFSKVGLNFKTPPPEGAIITMDATLDLPYKTPDGSMTFSYQATLNAPTSS